jgi:hypothetical protein
MSTTIAQGPVGPLYDSRRLSMTKKTRKAAKPPKPAIPTNRAKAAKQDSRTKRIKPAKPAGKTYVIFGTTNTPSRAARFSADPDLLAKAAEALRLRLIEVEAANEELAEVSAKLPAAVYTPPAKDWCPISRGCSIPNCCRR